MNNIELNEQVIQMIPKDILLDVPEEKKEEFKRGIMLYLLKERTELYNAVQAETLSEETKQELVQAINDFQRVVKSRHGGKNA